MTMRRRARCMALRFLAAERGTLGIIFAISAIPLIMAVGIGIDYARALEARSKLQSAVDIAVLAGVTEPPQQQAAAATEVFNANAGDAGSMVSSVAFVIESDGSLAGSVDAAIPTVMLGIMRLSKIELGVTAAARAGLPEANDVCLLLTAHSKAQSLLANGGARVTAPDCEIHVRSTANPGAIFNGNTQFDVERVCVKSSRVIVNGNADPPVETYCDAINDPFAGTMPQPSTQGCDHTNQVFNSGPVTLSPGTYCGNTIFNGSMTINMLPGHYVIKDGTMIVNGGSSLAGDGVTIHLANAGSDLRFNGNVGLDLSAPSSGVYAGILLYEPPGLPNSQLVFNGGNSANFEGLVYLPSRDVTMNGAANMTVRRQTMVFHSLILNASDWRFEAAEPKMQSAGDGPGNAVLVR